MREQTVGVLASIIQEHVGAAVPASVVSAYAHAASGCGEQLARWWRRSPEIPVEEISGHAARFIWGGIRAIDETS